jgi:hypothetical protein
MVFEIFKIQRNAVKTQSEPAVIDTPDVDTDSQAESTSTALSVADEDELSGIEIHEYARKKNLQSSEVWRHIREGRLLARSENGFVYVYGSEMTNLPHLSEVPSHAAYHDTGELVSFSQNAIERIQQLNDAVIAAKDEVISEKNEKIDELRASLDDLKASSLSLAQEREQLLRRIEDLEILAKALDSSI